MFKKGETIFEIGKLQDTPNYFTVSIFRRTVDSLVEGHTDKWWVKNVKGGMCGSCFEKDMFRTKSEAMQEIIKRLSK